MIPKCAESLFRADDICDFVLDRRHAVLTSEIVCDVRTSFVQRRFPSIGPTLTPEARVMGLHRRSIRLRIFVLILIPLLSLIGLYVFVASITVGDAVNEARASSLKNDTGVPVGTFEAQVDAERRVAMIYLAAPAPQFLAALDAQEAKTDQARSGMRTALTSSATMGSASDPEKQAIAA